MPPFSKENALYFPEKILSKSIYKELHLDAEIQTKPNLPFGKGYGGSYGKAAKQHCQLLLKHV